MRILFGSAHPYLPQLHGGAQSSTHELVTALRERGHEVAVLAGLTKKGRVGLVSRALLKLGRKGYAADTHQGYRTYRTWFPWEVAADVVRDFRPDVALFQSGQPVRLAQALRGLDVPTFIYLRNVETDDLGGALSDLEGVRFIANSKFTARTFAESDGIESDVIYPLIQPDRYLTEPRRRNVTFINPHPHKGVDIAAAVAQACPEIPFVFLRAWSLEPEDEQFLQQHAGRLPNVTLRPPTEDMRTVYRDAKVVLAPSRWNEAFGRIAAEAHLNGLPVISSDRGGLPEAVGPGGMVIDPDGPLETWIEAVRSLWFDEALYARYSEAALTHAGRPEMDNGTQIDMLAALLASSLQGG